MEDFIIMFLATGLIWFLYMGLIVLWFIDGKIKKEQVIHALFAIAITWLVVTLIKRYFPTLRPFMTNGRETDVLFTPKDSSFPSAHSASAFALAITIFLHDRKVGWIYLISALLIGVARVIANVHYPIDILGGALLGTLVAVVVEKTHLFKVLTPKNRG